MIFPNQCHTHSKTDRLLPLDGQWVHHNQRCATGARLAVEECVARPTLPKPFNQQRPSSGVYIRSRRTDAQVPLTKHRLRDSLSVCSLCSQWNHTSFRCCRIWYSLPPSFRLDLPFSLCVPCSPRWTRPKSRAFLFVR